MGTPKDRPATDAPMPSSARALYGRGAADRHRLVVEGLEDLAVAMLDPQGNILTWSVGAERLTGFAPLEVMAWHFSMLYLPEQARAGVCERHLEAAAASGRFVEEGVRRRKDGTRFRARVSLKALHDANGSVLGYAMVLRELTESEEEAAQRKFAERIDKERLEEQFMATVSHELRTPLNAILGWSELLADRVADPAVAKALTTIRRNAEAQAQILEDVLDVTRLKRGELRVEMEDVDLALVVRRAIEVVLPAAEAKGLHIVTRGLDASVPTRGDPVRLHQAVWNLLANAVKFSRRGGAVHVHLGRWDESLRLTVRDEGVGIDAEALPHVFDRLYQADRAVQRRHGGLGLGLAIVRHIVELHGGRVVAASDGADKGATLTLELPLPPE